MLLLPALAWLLMPRPTIAPRPPPAPVETVAEPAPSAAPRPRPAAPTRPAASASAAPDDAEPVTGVVLDPDGKPAARAFVACDDRDQGIIGSTDEEGRFRLAPEAAGCLAVASHPNFITSDRVPLRAGGRNVIQLERGGVIEGEVVDDRGDPITSYTIGIETYQGPSQEASPNGQVRPIRDERGAFRWDGLAPGTYVLGVSVDGFAPTRSRSIEVEKSRTARGVRIAVSRGATLTGRVLDADTRRPIAGARIVFDGITSANMAAGGTNADDKGAYALHGAPPGPFSIRVMADGYMTKIIPGLYTRGAEAPQPDILLRLRADGGPADEMGGIGAMLAPSPNGVLIGGVVGGGPAERAGLRAGDRIKRIDGEDATGMSLADCVQRLRGPERSIVTIQVEREGKTLEMSVTRSLISR
jgi:protocatechuate 3,4-dioxygenase beta subunit